MKNRLLINTILVVLYPITMIGPVSAQQVQIPDKIRVVIADELPEAVISIRGTYNIKTLETQQFLKDGKTVFPETPDEMASYVPQIIKAGVNIIGGCCGTTPEHILKLKEMIAV